jgi:fatty-acyl-CoA synthase
MNPPARYRAGVFQLSSYRRIMQSYALTVDKFLDHAAQWFGDGELVEASSGRVVRRASYAALRERSNRLSGALGALGLEFGDRVATLAWNTCHHFEIYFAAMGAGFVCHTLNPRLTPEHLAAMVVEADDRVLAASANLLSLLEEVAPLCPCLKTVIVLDREVPAGTSLPGVKLWALGELLEEHGRPTAWGEFPEESAAGLCYTSGTTGQPKGVLYTHRSNYLHTLRLLQADAMAFRRDDVILAAVPMFHANGWGLPFAAPAVGARLVLPGRQADGKSLAALMREERVTVAVGVQTVWLGVAEYLEQTGDTLPDLQRVIIGGSNCPDTLIRRMEERFGAQVQTSWGMTELSPLGTISPPNAEPGESIGSGRPPIGLELKLTDASGKRLPAQRNAVGHLRVRGPSVVDHYYASSSDVLDEEGFFDTGDLAMIGDDGSLTICGRSKDLIKSGGEWINPTEIEAIVGRDSGIDLVAVISEPDEKWGERPLLVVQPQAGSEVDAQRLVRSLRGKVADWWIPERMARIAAMPLAASGKIDKNRLRAQLAAGELLTEEIDG